MREDWEVKKLGEICDSLNGLWTGKNPPFITISVIRNTNFSKDCKLLLDNIAIIEVEKNQYSSKKLKYGDIIIEKSGGSDKQPVGRPVIFKIEEGEYSFSNFTSTLRIADKKKVFPDFLYYQLKFFYLDGRTLKMQTKTTGLRNLQMHSYLNQKILLPPLQTQHQIVEELDCLTSIIDKQKKQLEELDNLEQAIFYDMFGDPIENEKGWELKKMKDIVHNNCSLSYGIVQPMEDTVNGVPLVRPIDLVDTFVNNSNLKRTQKEISEKFKRTILTGDEILLCVRGTTGIVSLINKSFAGYNVTRGIVPILLSNLYNRWFIFYQIKTPSIQQKISDLTNGIALKQINIKDLRELLLISPPLPLQQQFASKIEAIEKQKELIKKSIKETEDLFNSRMDYYFN